MWEHDIEFSQKFTTLVYNGDNQIWLDSCHNSSGLYLLSNTIWGCGVIVLLQLRDPKNDFIFNFNFDDKIKNLWTVWILRKINEYYSTSEKMSWANAHLNLCKLLETELRLAQRLAQLTLTTVSLWLEFLNFGQSKWKMIQHVNNLYFGLKN